MIAEGEVMKPASGKQDAAEIRYREKRKKSPPEMNQPAGNVTIKERALSTLDIAILFQVVQEIPGRVGPHSQPVQFMVTVGEIHHILPVTALAVKPATLTQEAYKLGRVGGGNPAAIRQNIHMLVHADNFLVLSL
jgi:hypothetical protein